MKIIVEIPDDDCLTCPMCHAAHMAYGNLYCELVNRETLIPKEDGKYQRTEYCKSISFEEGK